VSTWGKCDLEDDLGRSAGPDPGAGPDLERVGRSESRRRILVPVISAILAVGLLWLKPWSQPPERLSDVPLPTLAIRGAQVVATASAVPSAVLSTASPRPEPPGGQLAARPRQCLAPNLWRIVSLETVTRSHSRIRSTRTLYGAVPVAADGPDDPDMPVSMLFADALSAVGICVPRSPVVSAATTLLHVVLWHVAEDGTAREILRPVVVDNNLYDVGEAYFGPPVGEGPFWPEGRYVFEIRRMEGPESRWIALQFVPTEG
jgi:hypothetical protein